MATCHARWLGQHPHPTITVHLILASPHPLDVVRGVCRAWNVYPCQARSIHGIDDGRSRAPRQGGSMRIVGQAQEHERVGRTSLVSGSVAS